MSPENKHDVGTKGIFLVENQSSASIITTPPEEKPPAHPTSQTTKEWLLSVLMLVSYVALNTGAAQLSSLAFQQQNFTAPYLFVLFKTFFRALAFPIYLVVNTIAKLVGRRKLDYRRTWRRCLRVCGDDITIRILFIKFFPPMFFNLAVQVAYTLALQSLKTSLASALTPPTLAISYLMSRFFLNTPMLLIKVLFVLVSFAGVAVIVYFELVAVEAVQGVTIGIACMLGQDFALACYQLLFKKAFPKGDLGQVSFAVSGMYVLMFFVYLPVPIILNQLKVETYDLGTLPYPGLIGSWSCSAVSSLVYGYGLVIAGGFFMSLSELLILASNSGIDALFRSFVIPVSQIAGTVVIAMAFIVLVLPDRYVSIAVRRRFLAWRPMYGQKITDLTKQTESQITLELESPSEESPPPTGYPSDASLDSDAIGEEDILENRDMHISAEDTQVKL